jgi:hypothetical protein
MSIYAGLLGGAMGSVVFSILMEPLSLVLQTQTVAAYLAALFTPELNMALGYLIQLMGGALFGLLYAALWRAGIGAPTIFWGVAFGWYSG